MKSIFRKIENELKKTFWKLPLSIGIKKKLKAILSKAESEDLEVSYNSIKNIDAKELKEYIFNILQLPSSKSDEFVGYIEHNSLIERKAKIVAYYLPQFHPTEKNDLWWGKGTTEWNNVSKAVPQYPGHIQPKLPGELGFYDLRIPAVMDRQIQLAKNYGIDVFSFYYYWFDGERILEKPLDMFIENKQFDIEFCLCWANENWTKRFSGTNTDILMKMSETEESYKKFIHDALSYLKDQRYYMINDKLVLVIYRPSLIPNHKEVLSYWRDVVYAELDKELYIIASSESRIDIDWTKFGFDAMSQFQPNALSNDIKEITSKINPIRKDFSGTIYDYEDIVINQKYGFKNSTEKKYPAVMPRWDNTARRDYKGIIYHGSSPILYKRWLKRAIEYANNNKSLDIPMIFINAWNEWGEGAYLEPDKEYGYAFLEATWQSVCED